MLQQCLVKVLGLTDDPNSAGIDSEAWSAVEEKIQITQLISEEVRLLVGLEKLRSQVLGGEIDES
jgi:hypothetical protein